MAGGEFVDVDAIGVRYVCAARLVKAIAYLSGRGHTCKEVAEHLQVHPRTAIRLIGAIETITPLYIVDKRPPPSQALVYKVDGDWMKRFI